MKNIMKKDFYQIKHNRFLLISFVAILLLGIFSSSGYLLDLNSRKDAIGIFDAMVYDSTVIVILVTEWLSSRQPKFPCTHSLISSHSVLR